MKILKVKKAKKLQRKEERKDKIVMEKMKQLRKIWMMKKKISR